MIWNIFIRFAFNLFRSYRANKKHAQMHARTHALTEGRPENIMPSTPTCRGGGVQICAEVVFSGRHSKTDAMLSWMTAQILQRR